MREAHEREALLLVFYVGHGAHYQADPAQPVHHFLQVWDTAEWPAGTAEPDNGWDPYATIDALRPACPHITGLILIVDACFGSWAVQRVKGWAGVAARFRSVWLASSRDEPAYDGCLTKTVVHALGQGVVAGQHPDGTLVSRLRGDLLAYLVARACTGQAPTLDGFQYWDPALFIAANRAADELITTRGIDAITGDHLLHLLDHYQPHGLADVVAASAQHRVLTVVGDAGTGKSTLAAALFHPPGSVGDTMPLDFVTHAVAFTSVHPQALDLAMALHGQLTVSVPNFARAAAQYKARNSKRWEQIAPYDAFVLGPLSLLPSQPARIVIDGLDQVRESSAYKAIHNLVSQVEREFSHVRLILTTRPASPPWSGAELRLGEATDTAAHTYLAARQVPEGLHDRIVRLSGGRWLVLQLAADYVIAHPDVELEIGAVEELYERFLDKAATRLDWERHLKPVLSVLAASAGVGVPMRLFAHAVAALDGPTTRAGLAEVLGDQDLYRIIDRVQPGTPAEQVVIIHATLAAYLTAHPRLAVAAGHGAILEAIDALAAPTRHYVPDDPLQVYAFATEAHHLRAVGRHDRIATSLEQRAHPIPRENLARWAAWLPHLTQTLGADHPDMLTTRHEIAHWTGHTGDAREALRLLRALCPDIERVLGADHPDTLKMRSNIAHWTGQTGDAREALRLYRALLPDRERVLGADHPDTLTSRINVAVLISQTGDAREALRLFRALLPDQERVFGADHPTTLTMRNNVAFLISQTGDAREALRLFRALLLDRERVLGADHPDTFWNRNNIAMSTGDTGDAREALRLFRALLPDRERVLGTDHPDTLRTRNNIAHWTGQTGDAREALHLFRALLPDQERVLGADHPDTLAARNNIAHWTGQTGDAREALRLFHALLPDLERVLGADHPTTFTTRNNVALFTGQTGDAPEALRLFHALLPDLERVLGTDHPTTLTTRNNVALLTGQTGDAREALRLFQALLPDLERVLGADHPTTLTTRNNIAGWTGATADAPEALRLFRALLPDQERVLGADHPDTLRTRHNLAHWTGATGDAPEALRLFRALLPDLERVLGADHPATLTTRNSIARSTSQTGDAREALRLFRALLPDVERVLGSNHPDTLTTRNNIAEATSQAGDAREALRLFRVLLPDRERVLGSNHPDTLRTRNNIAEATGQAGGAREALRLFHALLPDLERVLGSDHPDTLRARNSISVWTDRIRDAPEISEHEPSGA
jgi:hypothetical protein